MTEISIVKTVGPCAKDIVAVPGKAEPTAFRPYELPAMRSLFVIRLV
jgi:hypothetical protein